VETIDAMRAQLARNTTEQSRVRRELDAHETSIWRVGRIAELEQELASLRDVAPEDGGANARALVAELTANIKALAVKERELKNAIAEEERIQRESAEALKNAEALRRHARESDASLQRTIDQLEAANEDDGGELQGQGMYNTSDGMQYALGRSRIMSERTQQIKEIRAVLETRKRIAKLNAEIESLNQELTHLIQRDEPTAEKQSAVDRKLVQKRILETGR
jgi:uncharacterized Zn finger protein (UPF0148 family)